MPEAILGFQDDSGKHTFLSNFYPSPIRQKVVGPDKSWVITVTYPTVENYFQAQKSLDSAYSIRLSVVPPGLSKKLGRAVDLRSDWESVKLIVMRRALDVKFPALNDKKSANVLLSEMLLDTGDAYLEEGNTWGDSYWGVSGGFGANWLGVLLMARRTALRYYAQKGDSGAS